MYKKFLKDKNILFFGQENCENSEKAIQFLNQLGCDIKAIRGSRKNKVLPEYATNWEGDFIFSYRNYFLIPEFLIKKAKYMAINFHPATPNYPGSGACCWAIYDGCKEFGLTVHLMNKKYDNGKILKVYKFQISNDLFVNDLLEQSYKFSYDCFCDYILYLNEATQNDICSIKNKPNNIKWFCNAKKLNDLNEMREINLDMTKEEIIKRVRSFHFDQYPIQLNIGNYLYNLNQLKK